MVVYYIISNCMIVCANYSQVCYYSTLKETWLGWMRSSQCYHNSHGHVMTMNTINIIDLILHFFFTFSMIYGNFPGKAPDHYNAEFLAFLSQCMYM